MTVSPESAPNDPVLFRELRETLNGYHAERGTPFSFLFSVEFDPEYADATMNTYPFSPEELYGVNGIVYEGDTERYPMLLEAQNVIIPAGTEGRGKNIFHNDPENGVSSWVFNEKYRRELARIAEIAIEWEETIDIYWVEADGRVMTRNFFELGSILPRRVIDHELAEVIEVLRHRDDE